MSTINELCLQIEDLNNKIEDEPRQRLKRKIKIEAKIEELEDEKRRSGLRGDPQSVQKFNAQISKLKHELAGGFVFDYENEIKVLNHKILYIIVDYYKKGLDIEEISKIDHVPQNVKDEWLNKCDFGKSTGYLFVEEIDDDSEYNWRYYNPIFDIEYKFKTLDDLEYQIKSYGEVFLIFNDDLAKTARNKDFKLYNAKIDEDISDLKHGGDASEIFKSLKEYSNKLTKTQITELTEVIVSNAGICDFINDFKYILSTNDEENDEIYERIIESRIDYLTDCNPKSYSCLFKDLKKLSNKFTKTQITNLTEVVISNAGICKFIRNFKYILTTNGEENDEIYEMIIDGRINYLKDCDSRLYSCLIYDLNELSDKFTKTQINAFYDIIIQDDKFISCCSYPILNILSKNEDILYENYCSKITELRIDAKLIELAEISFDYRATRIILNDLVNYSKDFTDSQLERLCNISITNNQVYNCIYCKSSLKRILSENKDKIDRELYEETILKNNL